MSADETPTWTGPVGHAQRSRYAFGKPMHALVPAPLSVYLAACNDHTVCTKQYTGSADAVTCGPCRTVLGLPKSGPR